MFNNMLVNAAEKYVGIKELKNNSGFENKEFEEKMKRMGWQKGQPWCMYFVKLCIYEAAEMLFGESVAKERIRGVSGHVLTTWQNLGKVYKKYDKPSYGYIGFMRRPGTTQGHVFIVKGVDSNGVSTIEGNTNSAGSRDGDGVYTKYRRNSDMVGNASSLRLLGYINLEEYV